MTLRILAVGGSNTLMNPGYLTAMKAEIKRRLGTEVTIDNLAIGANNSGQAYSLLNRHSDLQRYTHIIVEYMINDYELVAHGKTEEWKSIYEGIVRLLMRKKNSTCQIVNVVLGRRDPAKFLKQDAMIAHVAGISERYGLDSHVKLVNVDAYLKRLYGASDGLFHNIYLDDVHYKRPEITDVIGNYVAESIIGDANSLPVAEHFTLPEPLSAMADRMHRGVLVDICTEFPDGVTREFKNSALERKVVCLSEGQSLSLTLPGALLALDYVSHCTSSSMLIELDGAPSVFVHTQHSWVLGDRKRFMLKNLVNMWAFPVLQDQTETQLTITAMPAPPQGRKVQTVEQYNIAQNNDQSAPRFVYLQSIYAI